MEPEYLTREKAAEFLTIRIGYPCTRKTLEQYVTRGGGPVFILIGRRPFYRIEDLRAWLESKSSERMASSSQIEATETLVLN